MTEPSGVILSGEAAKDPLWDAPLSDAGAARVTVNLCDVRARAGSISRGFTMMNPGALSAPARGARILFLSLLLAQLVPNVVGFFTPFIVEMSGQHGMEAARTGKYVLGFNAFVYAFALTPSVFGVWRLGGGVTRPTPKIVALLLTFFCVLNAWSKAIHRVSQGAEAVSAHFFHVVAAILEPLMILGIASLMHHLGSVSSTAGVQTFAKVTVIAVIVNTFGSPFVGRIDIPDVLRFVVVAGLSVFQWAVVLTMLWSGRSLSFRENLVASDPVAGRLSPS